MPKNISADVQLFNDIKLGELEYYKTLYKGTLVEWRKFIQGRNDIDTSVVPKDVLDAWIRCRAFGLDPFKLPKKKILTGNDFDRLIKRNQDFINVSMPFLQNLYQFLKGSGFNVVLFDREGYLLEIMGDHDRIELMQQADGVVGALWNEQTAGQNVSGTIVEVKKPIQIFGSQHYIRDYHGETGSGSPIFSPDGVLLGGITLNARNFRVNPHTLGMAVAAAYAVENELRMMNAFAESQKAYRYQQTVIASIREAMIAVDNFGVISLINDPAKKLIAMPYKRIEGNALKRVMAKENVMLFSLIENSDVIIDKEVQIFANHKWNDYTLTINPIISDGGHAIGKIIILNELKRAKTMATKLIGARATYHFKDICGKNPRFLVTMEQAKTVAQNNSNVLLLGKSGTGKDIFAQAIHNASRRKNGPYIVINCAAIPRDLIASELFGYEEGAFTGSRRGGSQGKFELADGGTIFLDEIAEMSLDLQSALLRVLEDKSITRIGSDHTRKVDVRILAATNKNLRDEVEKGNFREDLFYRLNVFSIEMLPLCERADDIRPLARWFIKKQEQATGKQIRQIDDKILAAFENYAWPGNIRELQNVIERMMNFVRGNELTCDLLPREITNSRKMPVNINDLESPEESEKSILLKMVELNFPKTEMADKLKISRATLYRKFKKYGISIKPE